MEVTLEKTGDLNGKILVKVTESDYADKVTKELKRIGTTHSIPGFRKGHISIEQLRKRFGKEVKSEILNREVYDGVIKYLSENKIDILGSPIPEEVKEINLDDKEYEFVYRIGFAPEIDLKIDKSVTLPYYKIKVSDDMKAEQDKAMTERFGAQVPGEEVDAKAIVKGALMELNADGTIKEGEDAIQNISAIVAPFLFKDDASRDLFMGKKINDKVVFNPAKASGDSLPELASMLNIDKEKAADVKSDFEMAISEIIVLKPAEHNQEFFDNVFGKDKVHNEEEYDAALTEMIARQLQGNSQQLFDGMASDYLFNAAKDMKLPEEFLKDWLKHTAEEGDKDKDFNEMFKSLENSFKWQLIKGDVMKSLNVTVTEEDMLNRAKMMAYQRFAQYGIYNMDDATITDTAKRILADKNYARSLAAEVEDAKMFKAIFDAVTIDVKEVSLDEFRKIVSEHNKTIDTAE